MTTKNTKLKRKPNPSGPPRVSLLELRRRARQGDKQAQKVFDARRRQLSREFDYLMERQP